jgi:hypothetical protein
MVSAIGRWPGGEASLRQLPVTSPENTSVSEWHVDADGTWRMSTYNDQTHLVGLAETGPASITG